MLITFTHNIFKRLLPQVHQNLRLFDIEFSKYLHRDISKCQSFPTDYNNEDDKTRATARPCRFFENSGARKNIHEVQFQLDPGLFQGHLLVPSVSKLPHQLLQTWIQIFQTINTKTTP